MNMKRVHSIILAISFFSFVTLIQSCDKLFDPCNGVICQNGGTCVDGTCDCPDGVSGEFCDVVDLCYGVTCQNDGTCIDGTCDCPEGTEGEFCETKLSVQARLAKGVETPLDLVTAGIPLDSLYGKEYQGGIIFFVNTEPDKYPNFTGNGMVTTPVDYGNYTPWGCYGQATGATGYEVGDGPANTKKILEAMCTSAPTSTKLVDELVIGEYEDWFMPSIKEMDLMYYNLHKKGHTNFLGNVQRYQSSTEYDANNFMIRFFYKDTSAYVNKISGDDIRPTRIF